MGCDVALIDARGRLRWRSNRWDEQLAILGVTSPAIGSSFDLFPDLPREDRESTESEFTRQFVAVINRVLTGRQTQTQSELGCPPKPGATQSNAESLPRDSQQPATISSAITTTSNVIDLRTRRVVPAATHRMCLQVTVTRVTPRLVSVVLRDVTVQRSQQNELHYLAYHDTLTGLPNRNAVDQRIQLALRRAGRGTGGVGILFCDLDNFKEVNDSQGHRAGDDLLRAIASRWSAWVRQTDVLARMSGDEFLLLADSVAGPAELSGLAHRLSAGLAPAFRLDGHTVRISMCIGGVYVPAADARSMTSEELLAAADAALYIAKRRGDDQLVIKELSSQGEPPPEPPDVA